jgi:hypothetical protein
LVHIQSQLSSVNIGDVDQAIWVKSKNSRYSCWAAWEDIRENKPKVGWWRLVWFALAILKQAFFLCLVFHKALSTGKRLLGWDYNRDTSGSFCHGGVETDEYLFFGCGLVLGYGRVLWRSLWFLILLLIELILWLLAIETESVMAFKASLCKLSLSAAVYYLWLQGNARQDSQNWRADFTSCDLGYYV